MTWYSHRWLAGDDGPDAWVQSVGECRRERVKGCGRAGAGPGGWVGPSGRGKEASVHGLGRGWPKQEEEGAVVRARKGEGEGFEPVVHFLFKKCFSFPRI